MRKLENIDEKLYKIRLNEFYVKVSEHTKNNLAVNSSMISYVRDKFGMCVKANDNRYDPTQKNKRIPNDEQYNAIVNVFHTYQLA